MSNVVDLYRKHEYIENVQVGDTLTILSQLSRCGEEGLVEGDTYIVQEIIHNSNPCLNKYGRDTCTNYGHCFKLLRPNGKWMYICDTELGNYCWARLENREEGV
jgi:hypothetical protein